MADNQKLVIVTGLLGAGMSSVLKTLEDMGFEVFDNFPLSLVEALLKDSQKSNKPIAIGIDSRARGFTDQLVLKVAKKHKAEILFLTCDNTVLQKRFTETRRRHPLAKNKPIRAGIREEKKMLGILQDKADLIIDTSELSIHDLRHILKGHFHIESDGLLNVTLMSFGFRYGLPREADIVMDVRFLQNPNWVPDLKEKTGQDKDVGEYISKDKAFKPFIENFKNLLETLLPRYAEEGKSYLTIAIGCTGGRHRSVYLVDLLAKFLGEKGISFHKHNRDLTSQKSK